MHGSFFPARHRGSALRACAGVRTVGGMLDDRGSGGLRISCSRGLSIQLGLGFRVLGFKGLVVKLSILRSRKLTV